MTDSTCACGAVGRVLPPDFSYGRRDASRPLMQWCGGRVGRDRLAVEDARSGVMSCPACKHRACVVVLAN